MTAEPSEDEDEGPPTTRVFPASSADADAAERALVARLRVRHIEILRMRAQLAEMVRRRHA